jgi:hypothetical protein
MNPAILDRCNKEALALLKGRTITDAAYDAEDGYLNVFLDNGVVLTPMQDNEGNGPGAIHWTKITGDRITADGILGTL